MKLSRYSYTHVLIFFLTGFAFMFSSCATTNHQQSTPYASAIQEIIYGKISGLRESSSSRDTGPLGNTRWRVVNVSPNIQNFLKGTEFFFERSGVLVESAELPNGTIYTDTHRYRVLDSTLVLTKDGLTAVTLWKIEGETLNIDRDDYRLTLKRINN